MTVTAHAPNRPGFTPPYQQVREILLARIASGIWRPAKALPSEQTLAAELGVSQGRVRKALDSLAADQLAERHQGKGTLVVEHTQESTHFRFFKACHASGERAMPSCRQSTILRRQARPVEKLKFGLEKDAEIFLIRRDRHIGEAVAVRETIVLSVALFKASIGSRRCRTRFTRCIRRNSESRSSRPLSRFKLSAPTKTTQPCWASSAAPRSFRSNVSPMTSPAGRLNCAKAVS